MLIKYLYAKLLVWDYGRLRNSKDLTFLEKTLINKSCLRPKYSYSFNKTYSKNEIN